MLPYHPHNFQITPQLHWNMMLVSWSNHLVSWILPQWAPEVHFMLLKWLKIVIILRNLFGVKPAVERLFFGISEKITWLGETCQYYIVFLLTMDKGSKAQSGTVTWHKSPSLKPSTLPTCHFISFLGFIHRVYYINTTAVKEIWQYLSKVQIKLPFYHSNLIFTHCLHTKWHFTGYLFAELETMQVSTNKEINKL